MGVVAQPQDKLQLRSRDVGPLSGIEVSAVLATRLGISPLIVLFAVRSSSAERPVPGHLAPAALDDSHRVPAATFTVSPGKTLQSTTAAKSAGVAIQSR